MEKYPLLLQTNIVFLSLFLFFSPVYAQPNLESATRETDVLNRREDIQEKLREVPKKPPEPKVKGPVLEEGGQKFFVKTINLVGCEAVPCQDFSFIVEKYQNNQVSLRDLENMAREIEREYLRRGIIAAVFIPPQEIQEQTVTVQVVEAKMGELNIQDHKYFNKDRLYYYWKVPAGTILRYDKISQSIQMMNKNPDREVKASLFAGKKPGTTDVLLAPQVDFPIHGTFSFDKEGIVTTGKKRVGYGLRHNNFLGFDDTFLTGYTFGRSFGGIYFYHSLPINYNGTSLLYGYSRSESMALKEFTSLNVKAEAVNTNLSLHQDIYKKDQYVGEVYLGFDAKDKVIKTIAGPSNRDRLRIFRLGGSFIDRRAGSSTSVNSEYSQAVAAFGATGHNNPYASRGAYPVFQKITMGVNHKRALPFNLQTNLRLKGQFSSRKLTPQEEFDLGGIDSVRGYPPSDFLADSAVFSSAEILIPANFIPPNWKLPYAPDTLRNQTTLVTFTDYGWGGRRGALTSEKPTVNMLGMGAGVRFNVFNQAFLRLEWGFPIAANNPITEAGRSRFHFSVDFQDKLPEEIERIRKLIEEEHIKQWAQNLVNEEFLRPGSYVKEKLYNYLYLAEKNYHAGNLEEAKINYEKIHQIINSLYEQAEDYVRSCLAQEKELENYQKSAALSYAKGDLQEARQLWQKIIDGSTPKVLTLEF